MHCPSCLIDLQITERQGIEIDYCPKCRGVWLDRGELDKIIERTVSQITPAGGAFAAPGDPLPARLRLEAKVRERPVRRWRLQPVFLL